MFFTTHDLGTAIWQVLHRRQNKAKIVIVSLPENCLKIVIVSLERNAFWPVQCDIG